MDEVTTAGAGAGVVEDEVDCGVVTLDRAQPRLVSNEGEGDEGGRSCE